MKEFANTPSTTTGVPPGVPQQSTFKAPTAAAARPMLYPPNVELEDPLDMNHSETGFAYLGEDSLGNPVKGYVKTVDADLALMELERAGIRVASIKNRRGARKTGYRRPSSVEFATLAEQFGDLMEIGESPTQVCRLLAYNQGNQMLMNALLNASEQILNGRSMSEAFAAQRDNRGEPLFPITFVCALRIGEEVGSTTDFESGETKSAFMLTLKRFAEAEKKADSIRASIRSALMYPVAVVVFCVVAVGIILTYAMPRMVELYNTLLTGENQKLPFITRIMIAGSDFLTSWYGVVFIILFLVGVLYFVRWSRTKKGSDRIKVIGLRTPVFGSFLRHYYAAQTLRTLAMLSTGIPSMTERFQVAAETSTNPEYAEMLMHVRHRFLTDSTDLHKLFMPYPFLMGDEFSGVLRTFERTADMQNTFHNYAKVIETRAERELEKVLFWFQNFAIVPVGLFVGFILAALYSPMFELAGRLGH
jgi:type IV pilus assembly protein PilC